MQSGFKCTYLFAFFVDGGGALLVCEADSPVVLVSSLFLLEPRFLLLLSTEVTGSGTGVSGVERVGNKFEAEDVSTGDKAGSNSTSGERDRSKFKRGSVALGDEGDERGEERRELWVVRIRRADRMASWVRNTRNGFEADAALAAATRMAPMVA